MMYPPFKPEQEVVCINRSEEITVRGTPGLCWCTEGTKYTIDQCVWSEKVGWMVSITNELHPAKDFK